MKVQVKVGSKWRHAEATIDEKGLAHVLLPFPYGYRTFKEWKKPNKAKANGKAAA